MEKATALKILDYIDAIRREEELKIMGGDSFSCRQACADVAKLAGFTQRTDWTALLLADPSTMYAKAASAEGIAFHG